jgi:hypothetical protein
MSGVRVSRRVRRILSALCWALAVASAVLSSAAFAGGGVLCEKGTRAACTPQTLVLVVGLAATLAFGFAGARLYRPSTKPPSRRPWEYPD